MDSPRMHISLEKCTGVDASHLTITAPTESPNTDGIHITHSKNVKIANSFIGTGKLYVRFESMCIYKDSCWIHRVVYDAIDEIIRDREGMQSVDYKRIF
ncbi:Glycosyl hydrolases family 28 [Musa troglodytarum]|nr:Glycosyl hydrolases family 28 [Musa troglodytarum]